MNKYLEYGGYIDMPQRGAYTIKEIIELDMGILGLELTANQYDNPYYNKSFKVICMDDLAIDVRGLLGKEIITAFHSDTIEGVVVVRVSSVTQQNVVNVIQAEQVTTRKLYTTNLELPVCTISFKEMEYDKVYVNSYLYLFSAVTKSSERANWIEVKLLDKERNVRVARIFSRQVVNIQDKDINPGLVVIEKIILQRNYGLRIDGTLHILSENNYKVNKHPDIDICTEYVEKCVLDGVIPKYLVLIMRALFVIGTFARVPVPNLPAENGFNIVRLARALMIGLSIVDTMPGIDGDRLVACIVLSQLYVLTDKQHISEAVNSTLYLGIHANSVPADRKYVWEDLDLNKTNLSKEATFTKMIYNLIDIEIRGGV